MNKGPVGSRLSVHRQRRPLLHPAQLIRSIARSLTQP
jgi:hypothetical protein